MKTDSNDLIPVLEDFMQQLEENFKPVPCPVCGMLGLKRVEDSETFRCETCGFEITLEIKDQNS
jgi:ribosomal protein L37AE/L43A